VIVRPKIDRYAEEHSSPEHELLAVLAAETRTNTDQAYMMVGALEGQFLRMLVHALQPHSILELGTFTGYSALAMASALAKGGTVVTCEVDPERIAIARRHIDGSPWSHRIQVVQGPALETISALSGPFDLIFIDADKENYCLYYDAVLPLLSDHGLLVVDNVLWNGRVIAVEDQSPDTRAIRAFNEKVRDDPRVEQVMLTVREGMTLIRKVAGPPAVAAYAPASRRG
jgi:caffeoyl-CoA O-methyltransferase